MIWLVAACASVSPPPGGTSPTGPAPGRPGIQIGEEGDPGPCLEVRSPASSSEAGALRERIERAEGSLAGVAITQSLRLVGKVERVELTWPYDTGDPSTCGPDRLEAAGEGRLVGAGVDVGLPELRVAAWASDTAEAWGWTVEHAGLEAPSPADPAFGEVATWVVLDVSLRLRDEGWTGSSRWVGVDAEGYSLGSVEGPSWSASAR